MDYSEHSTEQLIAEFYRQEKLYFEYSKELWNDDRPVGKDWNETMGMRDGCQMVMDEISEELESRKIFQDKNGVWNGNAFDSGESQGNARTYSEFDL